MNKAADQASEVAVQTKRVPGYGAHAAKTPAKDERWIPTVCGMCYNECSIQVLVRDGIATAIEGLPGAPPNYGKMCAKGKAGLVDLYNPGRVTKPLRRTNPEKGLGVDPKWEEITWEEALTNISEKFKEVRARNPESLQIWTFDDAGYGNFTPAYEAAFGGKRGTGVPFGPSLFCGNGVHPVSFLMNGSNDHQPDLAFCKYFIQIGSGYGTGTQSHAMGIAKDLANARVKWGLKMVVVDPCRTNSGDIADEWVPILPGTDAAFCLAVANVLVNELGIYDEEFLKRYTNASYLIRPNGHYARDIKTNKPIVLSDSKRRPVPYDAVSVEDMVLEGHCAVPGETGQTAFGLLREHLRRYTPEYASEITSVAPATIRQIAKEFGTAASVGATTVVDGVTLPLRPACVIWYRGVSQHQHGLHNGWSAAMLNILVGAVDVPGGNCQVTATGPWGLPEPGEDGLLITTNPFMYWKKSFPPKPAEFVKEDADMTGMFPVAPYSQTMAGLTGINPEKFNLDRRLEIFIQVRSNPIATTGDPRQTAEILKRIPFQVSFVQHHEASSEFADIILPDTHYLERLAPLITNPYRHYRHAAKPSDQEWFFTTQQPVVKPMGEARHWVEVLWELAERAGFADDLYTTLSTFLHLDPDHRLQPGRRYSYKEFADTWMRAYCGEEQGLEYFQKHGWASTKLKREVKHRYPRIFHQGRIPLYLEHFITAGESVQEVLAETGIEWGDLSDYEALVNYRPCWASQEGGEQFPLYLVNYKVGFLNFSHTLRNPQLRELAWATGEIFNVGVHPHVAQPLGISTDDTIEIEAANGRKATATVRVTASVHPRVISVPAILEKQLRQDQDRKVPQGVHFNQFLPYRLQQVDMLSAALDACVKVRVSRVKTL